MVTGSIPGFENLKISKFSKELKVLNLDKFFNQFENWILKDIKRLLELEDEQGNLLEPDRNTYQGRHRPFVAATILMCCAIDVLAAFRYGKRTGNVGKTFESFVKEYFKKNITKSKKDYDAQYIYFGLRNALVHGYSLSKFLALGHENKEDHLKEKGNRVVIDVFMLYYDLEAVYKKYKKELGDGEFIDNFKKRWNYAPLVEYLSEDRVKRSVFDN